MAVVHMGETWEVRFYPRVACIALREWMHMTQEDAVHTTHGTKTGATSVPLTELPFGFPGRIFRSPMPFGPYDLHSEVYDRWCSVINS
jgi:hypothetical protein